MYLLSNIRSSHVQFDEFPQPDRDEMDTIAENTSAATDVYFDLKLFKAI